MAKDNNALKDLMTAKVATLREALDEQFENRVKQWLPRIVKDKKENLI